MASFKDSQYSLGVEKYTHKGKTIYSSVGSTTFDSIVSDIENFVAVDIGYIPAGFEHRPDLISNLFFGTVSYWWMILLINNISDPFEGLNVGDRILIPKV